MNGGRVDWAAMVAILVVKYGQQLDQAWRFTLREFWMVTDLEGYLKKCKSNGVDREMVGGLEQHLRDMGIQV